MLSLPCRVPASLLAAIVCFGGLFALQGQTAGTSLQEVAGLKLNCPVPLVKNPPQAQAADGPIKEMLTYEAKTEGVEINLSSVEFKEGISLSIDGAINGAAANVSKLPGVTDPKHTVEDVPMAGVTAKRLNYTAQRSGQEVCLTAIYILDGQRLRVVQAIFPGAEKRARFIGETVVKSVRLQ